MHGSPLLFGFDVLQMLFEDEVDVLGQGTVVLFGLGPGLLQ